MSARIIEGVKEVKTLLYAHSSAVSAGDVIVVAGMVLIAVNDAEANAENVWAFSCRAAFTKSSGAGTAITAPSRVFYDATGEVATLTTAGNAGIGLCIEDADTTDTEVFVDLEPGDVMLHLTSAQKTLPVALLGATELDGTILAAFGDGASPTPGIDTLGNEAIGIRWNNHATPDPVIISVPIPTDLDASADLTVHVLAAKTGATLADATTFDVGVFFLTSGMLYASDADCGGTTDAMDGDATANTLQEVSVTVSATDISGAPGVITLTLQPTDGKLGTDDVIVVGFWIEYTGKLLTS
jgi:predicted RecA/RadA family phage recombinase